jgi:hypothetical protein
VGSTSLAIQYWELYCLVNEQNKSIVELWDGGKFEVYISQVCRYEAPSHVGRVGELSFHY